MSRLLSIAALLTAIAAAAPARAADWGGEEDWTLGDEPLRGSIYNEPKDWGGWGDESDPLSFEFGLRYWYSWGAHGMTVLGDSYSVNDTSHILEGHLRINDHASGVYVKGIAGYSAVINSDYATPTGSGSSQNGRIAYAGADLGYSPLASGDSNFGGFVGYQLWNDSPDMGQVNFGPGAGPNDITYHLLRLGLAGRVDIGGVADVTAEIAAVPYAPVSGTYGAFDGSAAPGIQTSSGRLEGWLYGATAELMGRFRPLENWTVGLGGRVWYLTGQPDVTFDTDAGGGTHWITKTEQFSTLRYGLLGEVTYRF